MQLSRCPLSLHARSGEQVPSHTVRMARASNQGGTTAIWVGDHLGGLWRNEDFADWYPPRWPSGAFARPAGHRLRAAPEWKAPSTSSLTDTACSAAATGDGGKPTYSTCSRPSPQTSSASADGRRPEKHLRPGRRPPSRTSWTSPGSPGRGRGGPPETERTTPRSPTESSQDRVLCGDGSLSPAWGGIPGVGWSGRAVGDREAADPTVEGTAAGRRRRTHLEVTPLTTRRKYTMEITIQWIRTSWTKESRGGGRLAQERGPDRLRSPACRDHHLRTRGSHA